MAVKAGGEKWVIQLWFHHYKMFRNLKLNPPQAIPGKPINAGTEAPAGVRYVMMAKEPNSPVK